jgi:hypothetical protein
MVNEFTEPAFNGGLRGKTDQNRHFSVFGRRVFGNLICGGACMADAIQTGIAQGAPRKRAASGSNWVLSRRITLSSMAAARAAPKMGSLRA